jgi:hypothetical protein
MEHSIKSHRVHILLSSMWNIIQDRSNDRPQNKSWLFFKNFNYIKSLSWPLQWNLESISRNSLEIIQIHAN